MKPEEQIKAIAELDGFKLNSDDSSPSWSKCYVHPTNKHLYGVDKLPAYLTSRDAIVPVIEKVCQEGNLCSWGTLIMHLLAVSRPGWWNPNRIEYPIKFLALMFVIAPLQLTEALLRATGKWKDE